MSEQKNNDVQEAANEALRNAQGINSFGQAFENGKTTEEGGSNPNLNAGQAVPQPGQSNPIHTQTSNAQKQSQEPEFDVDPTFAKNAKIEQVEYKPKEPTILDYIVRDAEAKDPFDRIYSKHLINLILEMGVPALLWGSPGVGKTAIIEATVKEIDKHIETIIASIRQAQDFLGYPMMNNGALMFAPPDWALRIKNQASKNRETILFIDEITTCPPMIQAAMLRVVNEMYVGDIKLEKTKVICAANPRGQAQGYNLSAAMKNRFCHIKWNPSIDDWSGWINDEDYSIDKVTYVQPTKAQLKRVLNIIKDFIEAKPKYKDQADTVKPQDNAYCSLRTWTYAGRIIAFLEANKLPVKLFDFLISGAVGDSASAEFIEYFVSRPIHSIDELYDDLGLIPKMQEDECQSVLEFVKHEINKKKEIPKDKYDKMIKVVECIGSANNGNSALIGICARDVYEYNRSHLYPVPNCIIDAIPEAKKDIIVDQKTGTSFIPVDKTYRKKN